MGASHTTNGGVTPRGCSVLAKVRGEKQGSGASRGQRFTSPGHRFWLRTDCRRVTQVDEVHWTRQRCSWQVEELAQQCADPRRVMAHASVQVSPLRYPPGMAATSRHIAYLPSLRKESPHLSFASASLLGQRLGCLARLLLVRLERLQGLCRVTQYCPFRGHTHSLCSNHRTPISSFHS